MIILQKNGFRADYTHVTEFNVYTDSKLGKILNIKGETDDVDGSRIISIDKFVVKDLQMTIIDWYIPVE